MKRRASYIRFAALLGVIGLGSIAVMAVLQGGMSVGSYFDLMYASPPDPILQAAPWVIGLCLAVLGFLWIRRIIKDIEDN